MKSSIVISESQLQSDEILAEVEDPAAGALTSFIGTVRLTSSNQERDGRVVRLEYEAFVPMALEEMGRIVEEMEGQFNPSAVAIHHRIGRLEIGEAAVVIAVSTPHRAAAFEACRYAIEELKKRVPIWKKEVFTDGAEWVDARP